LWHPVEAEEDVISAWREHQADYELKLFVEQTGAQVYRLEDE